MTALDRTREYIRQAQEGNQEAKEMLLQENTGLIWSIVKRFYGRGYWCHWAAQVYRQF